MKNKKNRKARFICSLSIKLNKKKINFNNWNY